MKSESTHWYTRDGEPMYTIIGANGKERNTNLRDARTLGLVPSVTTIIGMTAKPALENWKISQAVNSALSLERKHSESFDSFFYRCKEDANKVSLKAAEQGTRIHALIEDGFLGGKKTKPYKAIKNFLDEHFPNKEWIAEDSFCANEGYGGKIDLYCKEGIFVDFKTKDNLEGKESKKLVFDEHGMQLSAYAQGCQIQNPKRVSIFVDRKDTGLILGHIWDEESHERHLAMFNCVLEYWKLLKKYNPKISNLNEHIYDAQKKT